MLVGSFDHEDLKRGGEFHVDAINKRSGEVSGVIVYRDSGDGVIEVGFTAEYKGLDLQRALADAVAALRHRADEIASVAPDLPCYNELIEEHCDHAHILEKHAREIKE